MSHKPQMASPAAHSLRLQGERLADRLSQSPRPLPAADYNALLAHNNRVTREVSLAVTSRELIECGFIYHVTIRPNGEPWPRVEPLRTGLFDSCEVAPLTYSS